MFNVFKSSLSLLYTAKSIKLNCNIFKREDHYKIESIEIEVLAKEALLLVLQLTRETKVESS